MTFRSSLLGLCALAAVAGPLHAQTTAAASVSGLRYELVDLDLTDSIVPAISFTDTFFKAESDTHSSISFGEQQTVRSPGATDVTRAFGHARATVAAGAVSSSIAVAANAPYSQVMQAGGNYYTGFTLTPNTGLRVFAAGALDIAQPAGAWGRANFQFHGQVEGTQDGWNDYSSFNDDYDSSNGSGAFDLTGYLRTGEVAGTGHLRISTWTIGYAVATVPEPSTYAMLVAGALVLGASARRRRK